MCHFRAGHVLLCRLVPWFRHTTVALVKDLLRRLGYLDLCSVCRGSYGCGRIMKLHSVGRHVAPEMLALWIVEMILTFTLTLIMITPATGAITVSSINPAIACALTVGFTAFIIGVYRPQIFAGLHTLLKSTILAALLSFPAVWLVCKIVGLSTYLPVGYDSLRPIKIIGLWSICLLLTRLLFMVATRCGLFVHRVAVIGSEATPNVAATLLAQRKGFLEILHFRPEEASAHLLSESKIRTLVTVGESRLIPPAIITEYDSRGIKLQSEADFWEQNFRRVDISNLHGDLLNHNSHNTASLSTGWFARAFDILLSTILLITTLPIMCIVALLVRLESTGPVLYRQERVGLNGIVFTLFKFRSMRSDAEANGPRWAQMRDPRVTRLGSFMRKTRIDELPQLLNILGGEMSFIGPRPERPHFVEQLEKAIPCYRDRCRVKPGLTGWAQVNYPYGASVEDARAKLSFDLYYVKHRSLFLDILILLSTVRVILLQEGAR